eukprot:TRINITY_DN782_c1_g1_i3.p7 TRINITY_DN782_c1_g1~~TRINITY_DN782_c1_g1_i3.p7  ORF type:complete len:102 (+),score=10.96 TRINITY_DN782_c1_g1_i3:114-419(+)
MFGLGQTEEEAIWVYVEHFQYVAYFWTAILCGLFNVQKEQLSLGVLLMSGSICTLHVLGWRLWTVGAVVILCFITSLCFIDVIGVGRYTIGIIYRIFILLQ